MTIIKRQNGSLHYYVINREIPSKYRTDTHIHKVSSLYSNSIQVKFMAFDNICHQLLTVYMNMFKNKYILKY